MATQYICNSTDMRAYVSTSFNKVPLLIVTLSVIFSPNIWAVDVLDTVAKNEHMSSAREVVSDEELDTLRGGFALPSGLIVDFSFDKRIYQNGIESFYTYFELPQNLELSRTGTSGLASNFTNMLFNSITQNSLDNQIIRTINTVNIDISNIKNVNYDANRSAFFRNQLGPTFK